MASLFTATTFQVTDSSGNPVNNAKINTYAAGTLTPKATYTTQGGGVANANPVRTDAAGRASIWLGAGAYRFVITDADGVALPDGDTDNITGQASSYDLSTSAGSSLVGQISSGTGAVATTLAEYAGREVNVADFMTAAQRADVAAGTGSLDVSAAIAAAVAYCKTLTAPHLIIPAGDLYIGTAQVNFDLPSYSTVTQLGRIKSAAVAGATAVRIGSISALTIGLRWTGLDVRRTSIDTTGTSFGIDIVNLVCSYIWQRWTWGFGIGVMVRGDNNALSYLEMHVGYINDNKINLFLTASGTGYCNENSFYGGSYGFSSSWLAAVGTYAGTVNILEDKWLASPLNGNKFYNPGLESGSSATTGAAIYGQYTRIYAPRLEAPSGQLKIVFGDIATNCFVDGASGVPLAAIQDSSNNQSQSYVCIDGVVVANTAGAGQPIHRARAVSGDSTTRAYEARDTSNIATAWMEVGGTLRGLRLVTPSAVVAYSANMSFNAAAASGFNITATNSAAFAIGAPTNPRTDQRITVRILNTSGGALGVATWDAAFKMAAWAQPAAGFSKAIAFEYNGTNWVEVSRSSDVPN